jgi:protein TonB
VFDVMRTRVVFRGEETRRVWAVAIVLSILIHALLLAWPHWPSFREIGGDDPGLAARILAPPPHERSAAPMHSDASHAVASALERGELRPRATVAPSRPTEAGPRAKAPEPNRAAPPVHPRTPAATEGESASPTRVASSAASATSAKAPGAPSDVASVAQYRIALMSTARRFIRAPDAQAAQGPEGRVDVRLAIGADGSLARADVTRSSGHAMLDDLAVEILKSAKPHAPVPPALLAREFEVDVPVVFGGGPAASR